MPEIALALMPSAFVKCVIAFVASSTLSSP
jgi:hypothetical protein